MPRMTPMVMTTTLLASTGMVLVGVRGGLSGGGGEWCLYLEILDDNDYDDDDDDDDDGGDM